MLQRPNSLSGNAPAQLSKTCTASAPASIWAIRWADTAFAYGLDQPAEALGIAIGPTLDRGKIPTPAATNHIGCERPRCAGEAQHRRPGRRLRHDPFQRLVDRGELAPLMFHIKYGQRPAFHDWLKPRPLAFLEPELNAQRLGHHQDVREQDDPVEGEAANGLKRSLHRQRRVVAEIEEGPRLRPQRPVLRQVAPRLGASARAAADAAFPHEVPREAVCCA